MSKCSSSLELRLENDSELIAELAISGAIATVPSLQLFLEPFCGGIEINSNPARLRLPLMAAALQ